MSTLAEIRAALGVLAFGLSGTRAAPSRRSFARAYRSATGRRLLREKVTVLHCVTDYPTPFKDVQLRAMHALRKAFDLPVGLSDHSVGIAVPIAAAALGARVIEKHFTLDRDLPGPDHRASLEPAELAAMVSGIREVELALGEEAKVPGTAELRNARPARKSLVAARDIASGEVYSAQNVVAKRPAGGLSPLGFWDLVGRRAPRALRKNELIR
jgi:N-acetylneuraminate synthase